MENTFHALFCGRVRFVEASSLKENYNFRVRSADTLSLYAAFGEVSRVSVLEAPPGVV